MALSVSNKFVISFYHIFFVFLLCFFLGSFFLFWKRRGYNVNVWTLLLFCLHCFQYRCMLYIQGILTNEDLLVPVAATGFFLLLPYLVMGTWSSSWGLGFWYEYLATLSRVYGTLAFQSGGKVNALFTWNPVFKER